MFRMLLLATVATIGVSATEQSTEIYKDYVPSKPVWNVTMVKVVPNRIDDYLGGLKQSWVSGCEISKKMGVLEDCSIFISETSAGGAFNVMLVQKYTSGAMMEPDEARYNKFMADFRKGLEKAKQDELVQGYEEFRSFFGEMNLRRVEWK
ncbi:MAG: hypothetical protein IPJ97_08825 [Proteobacteria bacterium]|nr:hypothetical protein [Pseudomonadota bacterium]